MPLYFRLLDADAQHVSWQRAAREILNLDPDAPDARAIYDRYLARARWIVGEGWKQLLAKGLADPAKS